MQKGTSMRAGAVLLAVGLALSACGSSDDESTATDDETTATDDSTADSSGAIEVRLSEWMVEAPATAEAGSVTITAVNEGGETHELVVVRADSSDGFQVDETGKVDEAGFAEGDFIGEIEEFEAGTTESGTFELDPGTYVLFCNIVEEEADGTFESHFQQGMETVITIG
ncbi:MAG: hypothetical protein OEZ14_13575 [Acidimicrobiia bacterium]|nr:hypothetical protein [Acidimicrobiia bacterium]